MSERKTKLNLSKINSKAADNNTGKETTDNKQLQRKPILLEGNLSLTFLCS
jgi:hypothetical protein